ncbi:Gldg family protein [Pseudobacter ginsenosidimutans]|uniref:ABC-2 type transport system permease protein n=1 Tax=Pseudobacter ginsenosidimutans TaxID=661488 RepID=A0A4Q7N1I9_9BACT|nr:Gldg family protein [Pseudobacter ginsenosidimutans]QEC43803.1 ABC transporter permease subunit [Pseudobacter ginsenosidimutans]RZS75223.1 ABC-2 type transport system permease protein [Pseudobacter ginsenosidimutans]
MRIIFKIAKNELRHLFYSPIGWFLALTMLVMTAYFYTNPMLGYAAATEMLERNNPKPLFYNIDESYTKNIYNTLGSGLFFVILKYLYLFVPLLAMSVINKEFNNGTIRLLYSSPVKLRQIVLGKFLGLTVYNFILVAIIGIFIVLGFFDIRSLDLPPLLSGLLGLFLLLSALTAIAVFMSSLTSYQIVSALASFTVLFLLSRIQTLWQEYEFFRDITWFLAISNKITNMLSGLITTSDIIYYLLIICAFIGFTLLRLKHGTESRVWYVRVSRYLSLILICVLTGYVFSRPANNVYFDTTAQQLHSIHPRSQELIRELNEGPLEITLYTNLLDQKANFGLPAARNTYLEKVWWPYQRFKSDIHFKYVYYYGIQKTDSSLFRKYPGKTLQQIAGLKAKMLQVDPALFKPAAEMPNLKELESENLELLMTLEYQGRKTILRTHAPAKPWPRERNINAVLSRLLNKPIPQVYYVSGQLERSIYKRGERELSLHTADKWGLESLINSGFDLDTLNLSTHNIPVNTSLLVLADPRVAYTDTVMGKLTQYLLQGGNMIILGEPGKQQVLNPLLKQTGIQLQDGQLVQLSKHETPEKITGFIDTTAFNLSEERTFRQSKYLWANGIYEDSLFLKIRGATSLSGKGENGFHSTPLVLSAPNKSWLKVGKLIVDSTAPVFDPAAGDQKEVSAPVITKLSRTIGQKEQRIIVTGDADILSNQGIWDGTTPMLYSMYSWTAYNKFPIYTPRPQAKDDWLLVKMKRAYIQKIVFTWILPSLVLITGVIILIRRKRK